MSGAARARARLRSDRAEAPTTPASAPSMVGRRRTRVARLGAPALALLLVLGACQSGSPSEAPSGEAVPVDHAAPRGGPDSSPTEADPAAAGDDGVTSQAVTEGEGPAVTEAELRQLLAQGTGTQLRTTFAVTGGGLDGATYTVARAGGSTSVQIGHGPQQTLVVDGDDGEAICIRPGEEQPWSCVALDVDQAPLPSALARVHPLLADDRLLDETGWEVTDAAEVAGRQAVCAVPQDNDTVERVCVDTAEGLPLLLIARAGTETLTLEATRVERASAADVELPVDTDLGQHGPE